MVASSDRNGSSDNVAAYASNVSVDSHAVSHLPNNHSTAHHPILVLQCSGFLSILEATLASNLGVESLAFPIHDAGYSLI